jgi:hypothetical protein
LLKAFLGSSKGVWIGGSSRMRSGRKKELFTITTSKTILQENVKKKEQDRKNKCKDFS